MATYYIVENNQQAGPFTLDQLAAKGITPETNVWTDGMSNWTPASQVSELQSLFAPQPAPQPQYAPQPEPEPQPDYSSSYSSPEEQGPMPKDWKIPSIILIAVSIFCCGLCAGIVNLALGVMALLESNKIEGLYRQGNYAAAQEASDKAGKYVKIGGIVFGVGIVLEIILSIIYVIIGVANS
jgi:hypothetical protein